MGKFVLPASNTRRFGEIRRYNAPQYGSQLRVITLKQRKKRSHERLCAPSISSKVPRVFRDGIALKKMTMGIDGGGQVKRTGRVLRRRKIPAPPSSDTCRCIQIGLVEFRQFFFSPGVFFSRLSGTLSNAAFEKFFFPVVLSYYN